MDERGLKPVRLHLGCGDDVREGYQNYDNCSSNKSRVRPASVKHLELNKFPWPFESASADEILMIQVLEHLPDTYRVMRQIERVLKPGGGYFGASCHSLFRARG